MPSVNFLTDSSGTLPVARRSARNCLGVKKHGHKRHTRALRPQMGGEISRTTATVLSAQKPAARPPATLRVAMRAGSPRATSPVLVLVVVLVLDPACRLDVAAYNTPRAERCRAKRLLPPASLRSFRAPRTNALRLTHHDSCQFSHALSPLTAPPRRLHVVRERELQPVADNWLYFPRYSHLPQVAALCTQRPFPVSFLIYLPRKPA
jgi:hypothetical protein